VGRAHAALARRGLSVTTPVLLRTQAPACAQMDGIAVHTLGCEARTSGEGCAETKILSPKPSTGGFARWDCNAIRAADDCLAIERKRRRPELHGGRDMVVHHSIDTIDATNVETPSWFERVANAVPGVNEA
jgi:hypothetical protein